MSSEAFPLVNGGGQPAQMAVEKDLTSGRLTPHFAPSQGGKPVGVENALFVQFAGDIPLVLAGGTGLDYSVNRPLLPAPSQLLATMPENALRRSFEAQNQSTNDLLLVRDDGDGNQLSFIVLAAAERNGGAGGGHSSQTFRGRYRLYGPATSQVSFFED